MMTSSSRRRADVSFLGLLLLLFTFAPQTRAAVPTDIVIGVNTGENPGALYLDPNDISSPFAGLSQIALSAARDIFITSTWNVNASTGVSTPGSLLTLIADATLHVVAQ